MAKNTKISQITEEVWEMLIEGKTYRYIADYFGVKLSTLSDFLNKPEHSARKKTSLEISADTFYDLAERALMAIDDSAPNGQMMRQKELAQFYLKKAGKRNPKTYGDKIQTEHSGEIKTVAPPTFIIKVDE